MDVNLRSPWWSLDLVLEMLDGADCIKVNQEELNHLVQDGASTESKARWLLANTSAQLVVVTQGKEGAVVYAADGLPTYVAPKPASKVVDTVGAGDAFSAVMLLGQIKEWRVDLTLERAQSFASAIVGVRGAIVRDIEFYRRFLQYWGMESPKKNTMYKEGKEVAESVKI